MFLTLASFSCFTGSDVYVKSGVCQNGDTVCVGYFLAGIPNYECEDSESVSAILSLYGGAVYQCSTDFCNTANPVAAPTSIPLAVPTPEPTLTPNATLAFFACCRRWRVCNILLRASSQARVTHVYRPWL